MDQPDFILSGMTTEEFDRRLNTAIRGVILELIPELVSRAALGDYLTPKEVCDLTGWSRRKLSYAREQKRIPYLQDGRSILFRTRDIYEYLERGEVPAKCTTCSQALRISNNSVIHSSLPTGRSQVSLPLNLTNRSN